MYQIDREDAILSARDMTGETRYHRGYTPETGYREKEERSRIV
jgi:hypothetical protein